MSNLPRVEYEITQEQLDRLLSACKPTPVMMVGGMSGAGPQENANNAWEMLGREMGFDYMSVRPIESKGYRFFTAIPNETEAQQAERISIQKEIDLKKNIASLEAEIKERQEKLTALLSDK